VITTDALKAPKASCEILVTACTDPSWSTLFVTIKGLVTEVEA
jgi:hypothetical protein